MIPSDAYPRTRIVTATNISKHMKKIKYVLNVPYVCTNLLSVGKLSDLGHLILFNFQTMFYL